MCLSIILPYKINGSILEEKKYGEGMLTKILSVLLQIQKQNKFKFRETLTIMATTVVLFDIFSIMVYQAPVAPDMQASAKFPFTLIVYKIPEVVNHSQKSQLKIMWLKENLKPKRQPKKY